MGRPKLKPAERLSALQKFRLRVEEIEALQKFAADHGQTPSQIVRRLLRAALKGGPDYFKDEQMDLWRSSRELHVLGRQLNQIARAANRGEQVDLAEFKRVAYAILDQTAALSARYNQSLKTVRQRTAGALSGAEELEP